MEPFAFERATDLAHAVQLGADSGSGQVNAPVQFLAGGTTLIDLMKLDVLKPSRVVDLGALMREHQSVEQGPTGLRLGAFATMATVADNDMVASHYPVIVQSLQQAASPQLRNMATLGGNVLQRTRCTYYRDTSWPACNKRSPGSGCGALEGFNRNHAVLGVDDSCIAQYPGDFAVALMALEAQVILTGVNGVRRVPFATLHRPAMLRPDVETTLVPGDVITAFEIPAAPFTRRSVYVKVRDRASYEFAIASAAVALELDGEIVRQVRIGLGGMAYRPWRAQDAEATLVGKELTEETAARAADVALTGAVAHGKNDYKLKLGRATVVRALLQAKSLPAASKVA